MAARLIVLAALVLSVLASSEAAADLTLTPGPPAGRVSVSPQPIATDEQELRAADASRAENLAALLDARPYPRDWLPPAVAREDARLLRELLTLLRGGGSTPRIEAAREERAALHRRAALAAIHRLAVPRPPTIAELQAVLDRETAFIEYTVHEDDTAYRIDIFVVTPRSFRQFRVSAPKADVDETIKRFTAAFDSNGVPGQNDQRMTRFAWHGHGAYLHSLLIPPRDALDGARRLVIVPDGVLLGLPFAGFVDRAGLGSRYLLEDYRIVYAPSATALRLLRLRARPARDSMVIVGAPALSSFPHFPPIPAADTEVRELKRTFPSSRVYSGADARKSTFLAELADANLFHYAGYFLEGINRHAVFGGGGRRGTPALPLAASPDEDEVLDAYELLRRPIVSDTVVLATMLAIAPASVLGELGFGMAPALLGAGARSVVGSFIVVSDELTRQLMVDFYSRLRLGIDKDEALRQAQLVMMARADATPLPWGSRLVEWAGWAIVGDWGAGGVVVDTDPVRNFVAAANVRDAMGAVATLQDQQLGDLLVTSGAVLADPGRARTLADGRRFKTDIADINRRLYAELSQPEDQRDPDLIARLEDELGRARIAFRTYAEDVRRADPEMAATLAVPPEELPKLDTRFLPPGTALLLVAPLDDGLALFLKRPDDLLFRTVRVTRAELDARLGEVRQMLQTPTEDVSPSAALIDALEVLHGWLIAPLATELAGVRLLLVSPAGRLRYLPFAALVSRRADGSVRYLAEDMAVATLTRAGALELAARPKARDPRRALLVLANPDGTLPMADIEATEVAGLKPDGSVVIRGPAATAEKLRQTVRGYHRVHLATHAVLDATTPAESHVVLAGGTQLKLGDIAGLALDAADLVVLSACETAVGVAEGLEVAGMAYNFEQAGASSVVATLWRVADASTAQLIVDFYRTLERGAGKATALQEAQRAMIRSGKYSHPFHWAPFILIGDWR